MTALLVSMQFSILYSLRHFNGNGKFNEIFRKLTTNYYSLFITGLGFQTKLRPGVLLALSTLVDGKNFNAGGHKVGIALELEA